MTDVCPAHTLDKFRHWKKKQVCTVTLILVWMLYLYKTHISANWIEQHKTDKKRKKKADTKLHTLNFQQLELYTVLILHVYSKKSSYWYNTMRCWINFRHTGQLSTFWEQSLQNWWPHVSAVSLCFSQHISHNADWDNCCLMMGSNFCCGRLTWLWCESAIYNIKST